MSTCSECGVHVDNDIVHVGWHKTQATLLLLTRSVLDAQLKRIQKLEGRGDDPRPHDFIHHT